MGMGLFWHQQCPQLPSTGGWTQGKPQWTPDTHDGVQARGSSSQSPSVKPA